MDCPAHRHNQAGNFIAGTQAQSPTKQPGTSQRHGDSNRKWNDRSHGWNANQHNQSTQDGALHPLNPEGSACPQGSAKNRPHRHRPIDGIGQPQADQQTSRETSRERHAQIRPGDQWGRTFFHRPSPSPRLARERLWMLFTSRCSSSSMASSNRGGIVKRSAKRTRLLRLTKSGTSR